MNYPSPGPVNEAKDADGDTKMTGIIKIRAKCVSRKEIERRRAIGACIRCGDSTHKIFCCPQLSAQYSETAVKLTSFTESNSVQPFIDEAEVEALKW